MALLLLCLVGWGIMPWWIWSSYALGRGPGSKGESAIWGACEHGPDTDDSNEPQALGSPWIGNLGLQATNRTRDQKLDACLIEISCMDAGIHCSV